MKAIPIDLRLDELLNRHCDRVYEAIKAIDRRRMEAIAKAPYIVVTNETGRRTKHGKAAK